MSSVAIIGPKGQLGTDLVKTFANSGWQVKILTHEKISIEDIDSVRDALTANKSDWVINTAAFHKVDECEFNPEKAWQINTTGQMMYSLETSKVMNLIPKMIWYHPSMPMATRKLLARQ